MRGKDLIIRRFYQALGVLLVLLGIVSLALPVLPGLLMIVFGIGVISPSFRERAFEIGSRACQRIPAVRRFHRRQIVRLVLIIIGSVLAGAALTVAVILGLR